MNLLTSVSLSIVTFIFLTCSVRSESIRKLRHDLLKSYDPITRPVRNHSTTTQVRLVFLINQILDIDVKKQFIWLDGMIILKWVDEYMRWDPTEYEGQDRVLFDANEVWKPEVNVWNSNAEILSTDAFAERSSVSARPNGSMFWWTYITIASKCALDLTDYPFDQQRCLLFFGPNTYRSHEMDFTLTGNALSIFGPMTRSPQFAVTNVTGSRQVISFLNQTKYSCMRFAIQVKRRVSMFDFYVRLPHLLAILFAVCMFVAQPDSGHRPLFALLSVSFHLSILFLISRQLGMRSLDVPRLVKIISAHLTLVSLSLMTSLLIKQFIVQLLCYLPPLPRFITRLTGSALFCSVLFVTSNPPPEQLHEQLQQNQHFVLGAAIENAPKTLLIDWIILISIIDRFLFIFYLFVCIIFHV